MGRYDSMKIVSVSQNKKSIEDRCGDGYTTMCTYFIAPNGMPEMVRVINFMLHVFYHNYK